MDVGSLTPIDFNPAIVNRESSNLAAQEQAAAEFESVFVSLLMKEMRSTLSEGFFGSESSDVLGGMFDQYMGQHIASGSQFGIKELVQQHHLRQAQVTEATAQQTASTETQESPTSQTSAISNGEA